MSVYEDVTRQIIEELERGTVPWVRPWKTSLPHNAVSQKEYHGVNIMLLWWKPYGTPAWLTYRQAGELGGYVRKGEKATRIVYAATYEKEDRETGEKETIPFLKFYYVFNIEQCEGLPDRLSRTYAPVEDPYTHVKEFVEQIRPDIRYGGNRAYYSAKDYIQLPHIGDFENIEHYYATLLHEMVHFTGAEHRLNRDMKGYFGSTEYAREELVAEIGCAFLCAHFGIKGELRHAGYINSWLKVLKEDKRAIFTAARKAQEAADYLRELADEKDAISETE